MPLIRDKYVLIQLYVDDKTELPPMEQGVSKFSEKQIITIGDRNSELPASRFNSNSQPDYVLLDINGNLLVQPEGTIYDPKAYAVFLKNGLKAFEIRKPL